MNEELLGLFAELGIEGTEVARLWVILDFAENFIISGTIFFILGVIAFTIHRITASDMEEVARLTRRVNETNNALKRAKGTIDDMSGYCERNHMPKTKIDV